VGERPSGRLVTSSRWSPRRRFCASAGLRPPRPGRVRRAADRRGGSAGDGTERGTVPTAPGGAAVRSS